MIAGKFVMTNEMRKRQLLICIANNL